MNSSHNMVPYFGENMFTMGGDDSIHLDNTVFLSNDSNTGSNNTSSAPEPSNTSSATTDGAASADVGTLPSTENCVTGGKHEPFPCPVGPEMGDGTCSGCGDDITLHWTNFCENRGPEGQRC